MMSRRYGFGADRSYLEQIGAIAAEGGTSGLQWIIPVCPMCDGEKTLYVSDETGAWICYRCTDAPQTRADIEDERPSKGPNFTTLVALLENTDQAGAAEILMFSQEASVHAPGERRAPKDPFAVVSSDLPLEYQPVSKDGVVRMPSYLAKRGLSAETAERFKLGWCDDGKYAGRIIIPIECPLGRSFTARATWDTPLRYLHGPGAGRLLFGWDQAMELEDTPWISTLVIVEGQIDAMSVQQIGIPCVGLGGLSLRASQKKILEESSRIQTFTIMLDRTAVESAMKIGQSLGRDRCRVAFLSDFKDANEALAADRGDAILSAVRNAKPWALATIGISLYKAGLGK